MIQMNSRVFIADNTGAKEAEMIRRLGQNKRTADVGDVSSATSKSHPQTRPLKRVKLFVL